ncbi:MAG: gamma carbonic anhydrase family protein [Deltaproteobacteria bacterium]|nr:MAG: gamma carbonic anhydrase family protein [Deltaproteobacteria bacterium]
MVLAYKGIEPQLDASVFIAPGACVIGDVHIGEKSSIWFNVIVRGDVNFIRIGSRTNIQDGSVVHVTSDTHPTFVGDDVTVGHSVTLHGCTVHDGCLIGIGAIVLDGAVVGASSLVAAGSLISPNTQIPPRSLVMGSPGRVKRTLTEEECSNMHAAAQHYIQCQENYQSQSKLVIRDCKD